MGPRASSVWESSLMRLQASSDSCSGNVLHVMRFQYHTQQIASSVISFLCFLPRFSFCLDVPERLLPCDHPVSSFLHSLKWHRVPGNGIGGELCKFFSVKVITHKTPASARASSDIDLDSLHMTANVKEQHHHFLSNTQCVIQCTPYVESVCDIIQFLDRMAQVGMASTKWVSATNLILFSFAAWHVIPTNCRALCWANYSVGAFGQVLLRLLFITQF